MTPPQSRHTQSRASERALRLALSLVIAFMVAEFATSFVAHSLALLADSFHLLTDVASLTLALVAVRISRRPSSGSMTYGLQRSEVLAAALNGLGLCLAAIIVTIGALQRLVSPVTVHGYDVLVVASVGICVNLFAARILHPSHESTLNHRAAFAHVVIDMVGSACALAAGVVLITTHWQRADAVASLAVAVLMTATTVRLLVASGRVLLEGTPVGVNLEHVRTHLLSEPDVLDVHDLHAWVVSSNLPALSAHVVVNQSCFEAGRAPSTLDRLQRCLVGHFDLAHSTLQLELPGHLDHETEIH
jgi:cobalt-zinc-cadmium efflux system protein